MGDPAGTPPQPMASSFPQCPPCLRRAKRATMPPNGTAMHPGNAASSPDRDVLVQLGLHDLPVWKRVRTGHVLLAAALAVTSYAAATMLFTGKGENLLKIASAISGALVLVLGYLQWREIRHEISYDRYYDRLAGVNERFNAYRLDALAGDPAEKRSHLNTMFVFGELDLLEYMLGKRRLGYVREELAERAIRSFRSRCGDPNFCRDVLYWVGRHEGDQRARGYERVTREAARLIIGSCGHYLSGTGEQNS